jgi:hypothetical protein
LLRFGLDTDSLATHSARVRSLSLDETKFANFPAYTFRVRAAAAADSDRSIVKLGAGVALAMINFAIIKQGDRHFFRSLTTELNQSQIQRICKAGCSPNNEFVFRELSLD